MSEKPLVVKESGLGGGNTSALATAVTRELQELVGDRLDYARRKFQIHTA